MRVLGSPSPMPASSRCAILCLSYWFPVVRPRAGCRCPSCRAISDLLPIGAQISVGIVSGVGGAPASATGSGCSARGDPGRPRRRLRALLPDDGPEHAALAHADEKRWLPGAWSARTQPARAPSAARVGVAVKEPRDLGAGEPVLPPWSSSSPASASGGGEIVDAGRRSERVGPGFAPRSRTRSAIVGLVADLAPLGPRASATHRRRRASSSRRTRAPSSERRRPRSPPCPRARSACSSCSARTRRSGRCRPPCSAARAARRRRADPGDRGPRRLVGRYLRRPRRGRDRLRPAAALIARARACSLGTNSLRVSRRNRYEPIGDEDLLRAHLPGRLRGERQRGEPGRCVSEIGVLADDLTGALGSAARLRRGGLEPVVVWRPEDLPDAFRPRAVVVDMRTRDSPRRPARDGARVGRAAARARLRALRAAHRLDAARRAGRGARRPARGRAARRRGRRRRARRGRTPGACASAAASGRAARARGRGRAGAVRRRSRPRSCAREALVERVRAGAVRRFVVDGERDERPARSGRGRRRAGRELGRHRVARRLAALPPGRRRGAGGEFVLVVLSSNTALNHRQLDALARGWPRAPDAELTARRRAPCWSRRSPTPRPTTRTATHASPTRPPPPPPRCSADAHERGLRCRGVVASGGHLASLLVDALGAQRLVRGRRGRAAVRARDARRRPWSGLPVVTKGGLVGDDGTLAALVDDLWKEDGWDGRRSR